MSYRRALSFTENEKDLLDYFDQNGKSDIAKIALKYYMDNKDKVISDEMKVEILKLIGQLQTKPPQSSNGFPTKTHEIQDKLQKLIKRVD